MNLKRAAAVAATTLALTAGTAGVASADENGWVEVHGTYVFTNCAHGGPIWCDKNGSTDSKPYVGHGRRIPVSPTGDGHSITMLTGYCTTDWDPEPSQMCS